MENATKDLFLKPDTLEESHKVIDSLSKKITELEEKINLDSNNSSKPPSSDLFKKKKNKNKENSSQNSNNSRGGQPGHKGVARKPSISIDEIMNCGIDDTCSCGGNISVSEAFHKHQVTEIVDNNPKIIEFHIYKGRCTKCGMSYTGKLLEGYSYHCLGPNAIAIIAELSIKYHLSVKKIQELLYNFYGIKVSTGTISNHQNIVSESLKKSHEELLKKAQGEKAINADETRHKENNEINWAWVATSINLTVFLFNKSRGRKVAKSLLGEDFKGLLISDRYAVYNYIPSIRRQVCLAHLKRDITRIAMRSGVMGKIGDQLLFYFQKLYKYWYKFKNQEISKNLLIKVTEPIRYRFELALESATKCGHTITENTCKNILKLKKALWNFIEVDGVEPTNNLAERQLRSYVIKRKISFGSKSDRGTRFLERVFSVILTCKQQAKNSLIYIKESIAAYFSGASPPVLL